MFQRWRDLLFLHLSAEPAAIARLLPDGLELDTYPDEQGRERAWIGLVPFRMSGIRARGGLAMPWLSAFPETNVRTYVHRKGKQPGVWFFSLEAARWLACRFARTTFGLNYKHSRMSVARRGNQVEYTGRRQDPPTPGEYRIEATLGEALPQPKPGSFEFFLIERYLLYSMHRGAMVTGRVAHEPYALRSAEVVSSVETLLAAAGIPSEPWKHACFSEGVDVRVYGVERV